MKYLVSLILVSVNFYLFSQNNLPSNGRVGIGTNTPTALLDVNGKAVFRDTIEINNKLFLSALQDTSYRSARSLGILPNG